MIHYKFKNAKKWDSVTSETGSVFSVIDLKRAIVQQKKLASANQDFDLVLTNAQTGEAYRDDGFLIPKNTSLIVRRVPATRARSLVLRQGKDGEKDADADEDTTLTTNDDFGGDVYADAIKAAEAGPTAEEQEEEKMLAVLQKAAQYKSYSGANTVVYNQGNEGTGSTDDFRRGNLRPGEGGGGGRNEFAGARGAGGPNQYNNSGNGVPPPYYICYRCNQPGHYIRFCPTNGDPAYDFKRPRNPTGIPKSFLKPIEDPNAEDREEREIDGDPNGDRLGGVMMLGEGQFAVAQPNEGEFLKAFGKGPGRRSRYDDDDNRPNKRARTGPRTDPSLLCPLCKSVLKNAVAISCCFATFCDECIRQALLADQNFTCPSCKERNISPEDDLTANKGIRKRVEEYLGREGASGGAASPQVRPQHPGQQRPPNQQQSQTQQVSGGGNVNSDNRNQYHTYNVPSNRPYNGPPPGGDAPAAGQYYGSNRMENEGGGNGPRDPRYDGPPDMRGGLSGRGPGYQGGPPPQHGRGPGYLFGGGPPQHGPRGRGGPSYQGGHPRGPTNGPMSDEWGRGGPNGPRGPLRFRGPAGNYDRRGGWGRGDGPAPSSQSDGQRGGDRGGWQSWDGDSRGGSYGDPGRGRGGGGGSHADRGVLGPPVCVRCGAQGHVASNCVLSSGTRGGRGRAPQSYRQGSGGSSGASR